MSNIYYIENFFTSVAPQRAPKDSKNIWDGKKIFFAVVLEELIDHARNYCAKR